MADASHSDRARLVRFWTSARGFWRGKSGMIAWPLTVGLVVIAVFQLAVQYRLNYWNCDFFNALARHDGDTLWHQVAVFAPLAIMSVGLSVISVWTRMTIQRKWRQWLTTDILSDWLADDHYRKLEAVGGEYKNAEYRISYDAKSATDLPVDLTLGLVNSVMTAGVFTGVLWSVGGGLTIAVGGLMVTIPGYLVIGAVIYALIFTGIMLVIGRNLPSVIQMQSQGEAEFLAAANEIRESGNHPASDQDRNTYLPLSSALLRSHRPAGQRRLPGGGVGAAGQPRHQPGGAHRGRVGAGPGAAGVQPGEGHPRVEPEPGFRAGRRGCAEPADHHRGAGQRGASAGARRRRPRSGLPRPTSRTRTSARRSAARCCARKRKWARSSRRRWAAA